MLSLPLPLLLLVHIHLLGYPHADEPEYDEHVFNVKTRGLRDRTKTMEDLCYFLVGKIEHKPRLKSLFPTYPCSQPSDSVAFRAVLAKYLEGLRNHVVRPETLSKFQSTSSSSKAKSPGPATTLDPWWWKDVVVRKSLLEECTGIRFERVIIALSTHALFSNIPESLKSIASDASVALSLLPTLPRAHVSLGATIRGARRAWERSAALLQQRQADLKHPEGNATANYESGSNAMLGALSLGELISLCESKREKLQRDAWQGEIGRVCLDLFLGLAGLSWPQLPTDYTERINEASYLSPEKISTNEDLLPPLPTAAAHHPQDIVLFSSPITQTSSVSADLRLTQTSDCCGQAGESAPRRVNVLITERLAAEEQTNLTFKEALNRMHTMREGLQAQLKVIAPADSAGALAQIGSPSDVPTPPAPSKDVTTEARPQEKNAVRPPPPIQVGRTGKVTIVESATFPLPKASRLRNHPSRSRVAAVPAAGPSQPTRPLKLNKEKHGPRKPSPPTDPPPSTSVSKSTGTDRSEAVARESPDHHQSSCEARPITTTTQERKAPIINFEEDEEFLPSDLKPNIKPPAPPKYDFIEDDSAFLPSFLKRDMVQMEPARQQARPASASLASSRGSTPERGTRIPSTGDSKDEDDWSYEGKSMTLRDILVRAGDATFAHFDILHEEDVDVADETLGWE